MTFFADLPGLLAFRTRALRSLAGRGALAAGVVIFSVGFLAYALVRNSVYANLPEILDQRSGPIGSFFDLKLLQVLLFLMVIYIPVEIILSRAIAGSGFNLSFSKQEYKAHSSVLLILWGLLNLIAAPLQWLVPHFLIIGMLEISVGMLVRLILVLSYTFWSIKHLNYLSTVQSLGVIALSCITFPVYYLLIYFKISAPKGW